MDLKFEMRVTRFLIDHCTLKIYGTAVINSVLHTHTHALTPTQPQPHPHTHTHKRAGADTRAQGRFAIKQLNLTIVGK